MIKLFEQYNQYNHVKEWLDEMGITKYSIKNDLTVDVNGDVNLYRGDIFEIPIQFDRVSGDFTCADNNLTSLKGCPNYVGGDFSCSRNNLTTLEYCPPYIGESFSCSNNQITSLKGCPTQIHGDFYSDDNSLTTLEGCPKYIGGVFYCSDNQITSLEHFPEYINSEIYLSSNPLPEEILEFEGNLLNLIKNQKEYGVWKTDGSFNKGRFEIFKNDLENGNLNQ